MSGFTKNCIYCNKEIRLSNDTGRWLPYNLDNTAHECKKSSEQTQPQVAQQPPKQVQQEQQPTEQTRTVWAILEDYNKRLKKVEAVLFKESNGR